MRNFELYFEDDTATTVDDGSTLLGKMLSRLSLDTFYTSFGFPEFSSSPEQTTITFPEAPDMVTARVMAELLRDLSAKPEKSPFLVLASDALMQHGGGDSPAAHASPEHFMLEDTRGLASPQRAASPDLVHPCGSRLKAAQATLEVDRVPAVCSARQLHAYATQALQGSPSAILALASGALGTATLRPQALRNVLKPIIQAGILRQRLDLFVQCHSRSSANADFDCILVSFVTAVTDVLRSHDALLQALHAAVDVRRHVEAREDQLEAPHECHATSPTALELSQHTRQLRSQVHILADLCWCQSHCSQDLDPARVPTRWAVETFPRGLALLEHLHHAATSTHAPALTHHLFTQALQPVLADIMAWIHSPALHMPKVLALPVSADGPAHGTLASVAKAVLHEPEQKALGVGLRLPSFLQPLAGVIVLTGVQLRFFASLDASARDTADALERSSVRQAQNIFAECCLSVGEPSVAVQLLSNVSLGTGLGTHTALDRSSSVWDSRLLWGRDAATRLSSHCQAGDLERAAICDKALQARALQQQMICVRAADKLLQRIRRRQEEAARIEALNAAAAHEKALRKAEQLRSRRMEIDARAERRLQAAAAEEQQERALQQSVAATQQRAEVIKLMAALEAAVAHDSDMTRREARLNWRAARWELFEKRKAHLEAVRAQEELELSAIIHAPADAERVAPGPTRSAPSAAVPRAMHDRTHDHMHDDTVSVTTAAPSGQRHSLTGLETFSLSRRSVRSSWAASTSSRSAASMARASRTGSVNLPRHAGGALGASAAPHAGNARLDTVVEEGESEADVHSLRDDIPHAALGTLQSAPRIDWYALTSAGKASNAGAASDFASAVAMSAVDGGSSERFELPWPTHLTQSGNVLTASLPGSDMSRQHSAAQATLHDTLLDSVAASQSVAGSSTRAWPLGLQRTTGPAASMSLAQSASMSLSLADDVTHPSFHSSASTAGCSEAAPSMHAAAGEVVALAGSASGHSWLEAPAPSDIRRESLQHGRQSAWGGRMAQASVAVSLGSARSSIGLSAGGSLAPSTTTSVRSGLSKAWVRYPAAASRPLTDAESNCAPEDDPAMQAPCTPPATASMLPVSVAMHTCLTSQIMAQYRLTARLCTSLLLSELKLLSVVDRLRGVLLGGAGGFVQYMAEVLEGMLARDDGRLETSRLNSALEDAPAMFGASNGISWRFELYPQRALDMSASTGSPEEHTGTQPSTRMQRHSVSLDEWGGSSADAGPSPRPRLDPAHAGPAADMVTVDCSSASALDAVVLVAEVPERLTQVITSTALACYQDVFTILLRTRWIVQSLRRVHSHLRKVGLQMPATAYRDPAHAKALRRFRRLLLHLQVAIHALTSLETHWQLAVFEHEYEGLCKTLKDHNLDLRRAALAHDDFAHECAKHCLFLSDSHFAHTIAMLMHVCLRAACDLSEVVIGCTMERLDMGRADGGALTRGHDALMTLDDDDTWRACEEHCMEISNRVVYLSDRLQFRAGRGRLADLHAMLQVPAVL